MANGKIIIALFFFILGFVVYLFYRWLFAPANRSLTSTTEKSKLWYSPFLSSPFTRAKIKAIHVQHEHKHKVAEKESLLSTFGKKEPASKDFSRLQKVIHEHHRTKWSKMTPQEQDNFKKLQKLVKQREGRLSLKEREEIMGMLRGIKK